MSGDDASGGGPGADPGNSALLTDLYQLAMLEVYARQQMNHTAVFEFFVRRLPENRGFLMAAGLEQALAFLEGLRFSTAEIEWLAANQQFDDVFLRSLEGFRFTGDVHAMPEGSVFFAEEPILRVTAPMAQAQLVETRLVNLLQFQTLVASKAARCVLSAPDCLLVDFGLRRAHGAEAGLLAARASYLAGFAGTATVLAGQRFQIPCYGTMAHSFIQAHDSEMLAFEHFARVHKGSVVLLIDTYDTLQGARKVTELAARLVSDGIQVDAVRLDSGDLASLSVQVREILDRGGCDGVRIFCSGGLDEYALKPLLQRGCPIDGFGIGTSLDVSADAPFLDCVYKLQEYAGRGRRKRSANKATWPGRKQVFRRMDGAGRMVSDLVTLESDPGDGQPLLVKVMEGGQRCRPAPDLVGVRAHAARELERLPDALRELSPAIVYPVHISQALKAFTHKVDAEVG